MPQAEFTEKLKIDYRWFDTYNITPRFGESAFYYVLE